jgi:hypothetical protein
MTATGNTFSVFSSVRPANSAMRMVQKEREFEERFVVTQQCTYVRVKGRTKPDGGAFPMRFACTGFQAEGKWGYEQGFNEHGVTVGMEPWPSKLDVWCLHPSRPPRIFLISMRPVSGRSTPGSWGVTSFGCSWNNAPVLGRLSLSRGSPLTQP